MYIEMCITLNVLDLIWNGLGQQTYGEPCILFHAKH